jgi:pimeloyl-ACP methyl ester carboxylesterase
MPASTAEWRSEELGEAKELRLPQGTLRCHEAGSGGPTLVFVHGALVNANLWRKVVGRMSGELRCVALDLPFGSHLEPMPADADLSPHAVADLIGDAIESLGLEDVTLVGNDTGGAFCQLVATRRPERLGRLVLTSCDAFDNCPPKAVKPMMPLLRVPGSLNLMLQPARLSAVRRRLMTAIGLVKRPIEPQAVDSYTFPALRIRGVRRDAVKMMAALDKRYTLEAAERLREFRHPALIAWSREDRFFPKGHAERLAELLPDARLEWIEDSYTFSPEDQPARLADLIGDFVRRPAPAGAA